jgi:hypothetical protein
MTFGEKVAFSPIKMDQFQTTKNGLMALRQCRGSMDIVWSATSHVRTLAPGHLNYAVTAPGTLAADVERHKQTKDAALSTI